MINEESYDLGYQQGRADERAELRELLEKKKEQAKRMKERRVTQRDSDYYLGKESELDELLAELSDKKKEARK